MDLQCPPLNRITLGQHRSDNNNQMIQLTHIFCVLLRYNGTSNIWLHYAADSIIRDPIKRRALYIDLILSSRQIQNKTYFHSLALKILNAHENRDSCLTYLFANFHSIKHHSNCINRTRETYFVNTYNC